MYVSMFFFVLGFLYFTFKKRSLDLLTVAFFALSAYFYPVFLGYVINPMTMKTVSLNYIIYFFYCFLVFLIVFFSYLNDRSVLDRKKYVYRVKPLPKNIGVRVNILLCFLIISFSYTVIVADFSSLFLASKSDMVNANSGLHGFSIWVSLSIFSLAYFVKRKIALLMAIAYLIFSLYVGSRAYFATLIIMSFILVSKDNEFRLIRKFKTYFLIASFLLFLVSYKVIYHDIKMFNFELAYFKIKNVMNYVVVITEPNAIMSNLNNSLYGEVSYSSEHAINIATRLFLLIGSIFRSAFDISSEQYSSVLMRSYYQGLDYGMGSSFWGELYYLGGKIALFFGGFLWVFFIFYMNRLFWRSPSFLLLFCYPYVVYITFYIHRVDSFLVLGVVPSYTNMLIFLYFISWALYRLGFIRKNKH